MSYFIIQTRTEEINNNKMIERTDLDLKQVVEIFFTVLKNNLNVSDYQIVAGYTTVHLKISTHDLSSEYFSLKKNKILLYVLCSIILFQQY